LVAGIVHASRHLRGIRVVWVEFWGGRGWKISWVKVYLSLLIRWYVWSSNQMRKGRK
jgi:hypothetical protein